MRNWVQRLVRATALFSGVILFAMTPALAQVVPAHLIELGQGLLSDIDDTDFADYEGTPLKQEVLEALRETRLRNWRGAAPEVTADPAALAAPLGLDPARPDHRALLDAVLASTTVDGRETAIAEALAAAGNEVSPQDIRRAASAFGKALKTATEDLETAYDFDMPDGRTVRLEWDPATADLTVEVDHGDERGTTVLHGAAPAALGADGTLAWGAAQADDAPVTYLSDAFQDRVALMVFGVWRDGDDTWIIRPPGEAPARIEAPRASQDARERRELQARIEELRARRVHIWRAPDGGRVIQDTYRDLRSQGDYEYLRQESRSYFEDQIADLERRLDEISGEAGASTDTDWSAKFDPLALNESTRTVQPIQMVKIEPDGYRRKFETAGFDGRRVFGERSMQAIREFRETLPGWVKTGLLAEWNPMQWVEMEARYNVRSKQVELPGLNWAMHVTYGGLIQTIHEIHTPYSRPLNLVRQAGGTDEANEAAVVLRVLDETGAVAEALEHNRAYRLEAEYLTSKDVPEAVSLTIDDGAAARAAAEASGEVPPEDISREIWLSSVPGEDGGYDPHIFRSAPFYLRSVQFSQRQLEDGLYSDDRYIPEHSYDRVREEFDKDTSRARSEIARSLAGEWHVTHKENGGGETFVGRAVVTDEGNAARIALVGEDGFKRYESLEMRSTGKGEQVTIRFTRTNVLRDHADDSVGLEPLKEATIIDVPTLSRTAAFALKDQVIWLPMRMEPAPEEVFRVLLTKRDEGRFAGAFHTEFSLEGDAPGGQQTWARDPKIQRAFIIENQTSHDPPVSTYYPYRLPTAADKPPVLPTDGPLQQAERARIDDLIVRRLSTSTRRTIFLYGQNLPVSYGDAVVITSGTEGMNYDYRFEGDVAPEVMEAAWDRAREHDPDFTAPEDYDALVLTATFDETVKPGVHDAVLNGTPFRWFLTFPDAIGRYYFIDTPPPQGAPTDVGFAGDILRLEMALEADLPIRDELRLTLGIDTGESVFTPSAADLAGQVEVPLHRVSEAEIGYSDAAREANRPLYRSPPIHVYDADDPSTRPPDDSEAILVPLQAPAPEAEEADTGDEATDEPSPAEDLSKAATSPYYARETRRATLYATWERPDLLRVARPAAIDIFTSPADLTDEEGKETTWTRALTRARACYSSDGPRILTSNADEYSRYIITEAFSGEGLARGARRLANPKDGYEAIRNALAPGLSLLYEAGRRSVPITLGDHAASLLVVDEYLRDSKRLADKFALMELMMDPDFIDRSIRLGPQSDAFWQVNKIDYKDEEIPIGDLLSLEGLDGSLGPEKERAARDILETEVRKAAKEYAAAINAARDKMLAARDCNIEEMMVVSTRGAPGIVAAILPRLVRPVSEGDRTWWGPDLTARAAVTSLPTLRAATQALDTYAQLDTAVSAMLLAAGTGGVALGVSQLGALSTAAYVTLAADTLDILVFGTLGAYEYYDKWGDVDFARGAAASVGTGIYDEALAGDPSAFWTVAGVALPGLGVYGSFGDLRHLRRIEAGREVADRLGDIDTAAIRALDADDYTDFMTYARAMDDLRKIVDKPGFAGARDRIFRLNRVALRDDDRAFLSRYDSFTAARRAESDAGYDVARRMDKMNVDEVAALSDAERKALATFIEDVEVRLKALKEGTGGQRVALVSAREEQLVNRFGKRMAEIEEEAARLRRMIADRARRDADAGRSRDPAPLPEEAADGLRRGDAPDAPRDGGDAARPDRAPDMPRQPDGADTPAPRGDEDVARRPAETDTAPPTRATEDTPARPRESDPPARSGDTPAATPPRRTADDQPPPNEAPRDADTPRDMASDAPPRPEDAAPNRPADAPGDPSPPPARGSDAPDVARDPATPDRPRDVAETPPRDPVTDPSAPRAPPDPDAAGTRVAENATSRDPSPPAPSPATPAATTPPARQTPPLRPGDRIDLRDAEGRTRGAIDLGDEISRGGMHRVFELPARDDLIARVAAPDAGLRGKALDDFGRRAVEAIDSPDVRIVTQRGRFFVDGGPHGDRIVELIERVPEIAADQIARNATGTPTPGQAAALDRAARRLNEDGLVWADNHHRNYLFERVGDGDDWTVTIIDSGGIYKMIDEAPGAAARARAFQADLGRARPDDLAAIRRAEEISAAMGRNIRRGISEDIRAEMIARHGDGIDFRGMLGDDAPTTPDWGNVPFNGDGTLQFPKYSALSQADTGAEAAAMARRMRDDPMAAYDMPLSRIDEVSADIRDRGYDALADLPPAEAAAVHRAARRVADKLRSSGIESLTDEERAFRDLANPLAEGALRADADWRALPQPDDLPARTRLGAEGDRTAVRAAMAEIDARAREADFRAALSDLADDPAITSPAARRALKATQDDLDFRRKVMDQIATAQREVSRYAFERSALEGRASRNQTRRSNLDPDSTTHADQLADIDAEDVAIARELTALEETFAVERRVIGQTTARDIEWLTGRRAALSLAEMEDSEAVLRANGTQWAEMLKNPELGPGRIHQMSTFRKTTVDKMLGEEIARVQNATGRQIQPLAFGSNNLTSDYDLSLRVPDGEPGAADIIRTFNQRFRDRFDYEPGVAFDTNVYSEPTYTFVGAPRTRGGRGLEPQQIDAVRQRMFSETAMRRYATDAEWEGHKARLLADASEDEAVALNHVFDQVEGNHSAITGALRGKQAELVGGMGTLNRMESRLAELSAMKKAGTLDGDDLAEYNRLSAALEQSRLHAANETYADTLASVETFTSEYNRLSAVDLADADALRALAETPPLARLPGPRAAPNAYGRNLEALREDLRAAEAARIRGEPPGAALAAAEARRAEMLAELAGQARNRQGQALFFASEAYQTDGAIAHVVGELQAGGRKVTADSLRADPVPSNLTPDQYFDSLTENRANMLKEIGGSRSPVDGSFKDPRKTAAKASKYMIRQLDAAHQGGLDLSALPDRRVIDATVLIEANRGNLDDVARQLDSLGISAEEFVDMTVRGAANLAEQAFPHSALSRNAPGIADYVRGTEADIADLLRGYAGEAPAIELRRAPEVPQAQPLLSRIEDRGLDGWRDLTDPERALFTRALDDVRTRRARGGTMDLTDQGLLGAADRIAREADEALTAWRTAPPTRPVRDVELQPGQGAQEAQRALDVLSERIDRLRGEARLADGTTDAGRARQNRLTEAANELAFRRNVLDGLNTQIQGEAAAQARMDAALETFETARATGTTEELAAAETALEAARTDLNDLLASSRPINYRDIEWLSGTRGALSASETAEVEAALARSGNRWARMLKDPAIPPALKHRMTIWRKSEVNDMLDRIIDDVAATTGHRPERLAFGSDTLTSDYDLSIKLAKGPGSAEVVRRFNEAFRTRFGAESGLVFDTNVYTEPSYSFVSSSDTTLRGRIDVDAAESDRVRQAVYRETKVRRFASDAAWSRHRETTLAGLGPAQRRAFEYLLTEAEENVARAHRNIDAAAAEAAREQGEDLGDLRARLAAARDAGDDAAARALAERIENYELQGSNEAYVKLLTEIDGAMRGLQALQAPDLIGDADALRGLVGRIEGLSDPARAALSSDLTEAADLVDEARRLEANGGASNRTKALLARAEAEVLVDEAAARLARTARDKQGEALYFASEAYFTEGAIAHVVGELQAGGRKVTVASLTSPPTPTKPAGAYLDSFYENRGDTMKEMSHLTGPDGRFTDPLKGAAKVSKYFIRQLDAAHQAGLDLSQITAPNLIEATVTINAVRGDYDAVAHVLEAQGLTADDFADAAMAASDLLTRQAVSASVVGDQGAALAPTRRVDLDPVE